MVMRDQVTVVQTPYLNNRQHLLHWALRYTKAPKAFHLKRRLLKHHGAQALTALI